MNVIPDSTLRSWSANWRLRQAVNNRGLTTDVNEWMRLYNGDQQDNIWTIVHTMSPAGRAKFTREVLDTTKGLYRFELTKFCAGVENADRELAMLEAIRDVGDRNALGMWYDQSQRMTRDGLRFEPENYVLHLRQIFVIMCGRVRNWGEWNWPTKLDAVMPEIPVNFLRYIRNAPHYGEEKAAERAQGYARQMFDSIYGKMYAKWR